MKSPAAAAVTAILDRKPDLAHSALREHLTLAAARYRSISREEITLP
jgi:hypothetical protein